MTILLRTDNRKHRYSVRIKKTDWDTDKIAFIHYYDE
jgi:hypothetical protein